MAHIEHKGMTRAFQKMTDQDQRDIRILLQYLSAAKVAQLFNLDRSTPYYYLSSEHDASRAESFERRLKVLFLKEIEVDRQREMRRIARKSERKMERIEARHLEKFNSPLSSSDYKHYVKAQQEREAHERANCHHCLPNGETALTTRCGLCGHIEGSRSPKLL